jgi:hypothetical protein
MFGACGAATLLKRIAPMGDIGLSASVWVT